MVYEEEFKTANNNRKQFNLIMHTKFPHLKESSILRYWNMCNRLSKSLAKRKNNNDEYVALFRVSKSKLEFMQLVKQNFPKLRESSIIRLYNKCRIWTKTPLSILRMPPTIQKKVDELKPFKPIVIHEVLNKPIETRAVSNSLPLVKSSLHSLVPKYPEITNIYKPIEPHYTEAVEPSHAKKLIFKDLRSHQLKGFEVILKKYGFSPKEIAWLKADGQI